MTNEITMTDGNQRSVTVDISTWRMEQKIAFAEVVSRNDSDAIDYIVEHKLVPAWSFEGDPTTRQAWLQLPLEDFSFAINQIVVAAQERFRKGI